MVDPEDSRGARIWSAIDERIARSNARPPKGFERVFEVAIDMNGLLARWMPALTLAETFPEDLGESSLGWLLADLAPVSLRVMSVAGGDCEAFHVDFDPRETDRVARELADVRRAEEVLASENERRASEKAPPPPDVEGTWRDGRKYLPDPLPGGWRVGALLENGLFPVEAGEISFDIGASRRDGRRWVNVLFRPHALGRPLSYDEVRGVFDQLTGCGRFSEMEMAKDGETLPLLGMRIFAAPIATARPKSEAPAQRSESAQAKLIERANPLLAELVARARDAKRDLRDYCVIIGAERLPDGLPDGVVASRELLAELFPSRATDPYDLRGRFDEPRPPHECVVFVKHADGIEEIAVSLEGLQIAPEVDA